MTTQTLTNAPDLRSGYPRSPNESLGFYVILPRIIDKCRATIAGTNGAYSFNCPLDRQFFDFTGLDAEAFKTELANGKSDAEILAWVQSNAQKHTVDDIKAWSYNQRWRRPASEEAAAHFETLRLTVAPDNYRIETWCQLLDADEKRF
jgi:hypothetical protein